MIQRLFNHTSSGILAGASILALASLASRGLGFLRNALLASSYGAGNTLDAYFLAFRLPDLFFNLLFFGALSAGFVPVFIKLKERNKDEAWRLANDIVNLSLVAFTLFGIIFFFVSPWVLRQIAPGFNEATMSIAVTMSRIMFLQPIFLGISGIFSGILQSVHKFLSYSLAPIFYNLGIIFGVLVLSDFMGPVGLAWGVVLGALLHMAIQYPATKASGWKWRFNINPGLAALKRVLAVMVPRSLSLIVQQVNLIILVSFATVLGAGSVAVLNFASDLYSFPLGVVVVPLGVAAFPVFVSALGRNKRELAEVFLRTIRQLLFVIIPVTALALVLRAQVVRLTLGYGKFGWEETILTIDTLTFLLLGLVFQAVLVILLRAYFALEDAKTPLAVLVAGTGIIVLSALWFRNFMGVAGLALGLSLGIIFETIILFMIFARRVKMPRASELLRSAVIFILSALVAGLAARGVLYFAADYFVTTREVWGLAVQAVLATIVGGAVYLFITWLLKVPEIETLRTKLGLAAAKETTFEEGVEKELPR